MDENLSESSPFTNDESIESQELSFSVLNTCSEEQKSKFRLCDRAPREISCILSHLSFNETCMNIYIYIYKQLTKQIFLARVHKLFVSRFA